MRNTFTLFLLLFISQKVTSQNFISFPDSNAIWINSWLKPPFPGPGLCQLEDTRTFCATDLDTVVNAITYKRLHKCGTNTYKGAYRDNGFGQVYYLPKDSTQEFLLYDFTVVSGDTVNVYMEDFWETGAGMYPVYVQSVDSILINNAYKKVIQFGGSQWIQGIGNTWGLFGYTEPIPNSWCFQLECMSHDDTILYPINSPGACDVTLNDADQSIKATQVHAYPNPAKDFTTLSFSKDIVITEMVVFNSIGETVSAEMRIKDNDILLNLEKVPTGVYVLIITTVNDVHYMRLIKE